MEKLPFERIERKILIKKEGETDSSFGKKPEERSIEELLNYGIINLNKFEGPTSHQCVDYVKRILNIKKAGHTGTLDPKVTGVLPVVLGNSTKIVQSLLKSGKEYICLMHLHKEMPSSKIYQTVEEFTGKINQIPPIRSAVKRQLRTREIYYFQILEYDAQDILFKIGCEAGTYIRKICDDFGKKLSIGAHMVQLIRTKVGHFTDKDWHTLYDLKDAYEFYKQGDEKEIRKIILPIEKAIEPLPKVWVLDSTVDSLCHGSDLNIPGISKLNEFKEGELIAVLTLKNELICLGKSVISSHKILKEERGKAIKTYKVLMKPGTYPKFIKETTLK